ncbi:MAG: type 1 glutamine amidotransferase domain-containing protein [Colwellia sp.]|nr:type 1 glutamine amidotransferase domain-containing protein [Colwellia sp.]
MIIILLPSSDYDPTESGVIWQALVDNGFEVQFATPNGEKSYADKRLTEIGFSLLSPLLMPQKPAMKCYNAMIASKAFQQPISYQQVDIDNVQGLHVPGGHAQGMKTLIESSTAQKLIVDAFKKDLPVATVCHGVLLLARSIDSDTGQSVLHGRKTTGLIKPMELAAWAMTWLWLKNYYRTYNISVATEVKRVLKSAKDFKQGSILPIKDSVRKLNGFVVQDGNYLSGRWPGDCYTLAQRFIDLLKSKKI